MTEDHSEPSGSIAGTFQKSSTTKEQLHSLARFLNLL